MSEIPGLNSGQFIGWSEFTLTRDPQAATRSSSETSFLQEALRTSSLQVYKQTLAKNVIFDANKTATGVNVQTVNELYTLSARKEVILAAGAVRILTLPPCLSLLEATDLGQLRSPQMLMVSGIGPEATLNSLNIPVVSNLQGVGQNMFGRILTC